MLAMTAWTVKCRGGIGVLQGCAAQLIDCRGGSKAYEIQPNEGWKAILEQHVMIRRNERLHSSAPGVNCTSRSSIRTYSALLLLLPAVVALAASAAAAAAKATRLRQGCCRCCCRLYWDNLRCTSLTWLELKQTFIVGNSTAPQNTAVLMWPVIQD